MTGRAAVRGFGFRNVLKGWPGAPRASAGPAPQRGAKSGGARRRPHHPGGGGGADAASSPSEGTRATPAGAPRLRPGLSEAASWRRPRAADPGPRRPPTLAAGRRCGPGSRARRPAAPTLDPSRAAPIPTPRPPGPRPRPPAAATRGAHLPRAVLTLHLEPGRRGARDLEGHREPGSPPPAARRPLLSSPPAGPTPRFRSANGNARQGRGDPRSQSERAGAERGPAVLKPRRRGASG